MRTPEDLEVECLKPVKIKRLPPQVMLPLFDGQLKFRKTKLLHFSVTQKGT